MDSARRELSTLSDTVSTAPGYVPLKFDRNWAVDDPMPAGSPVWTEQRGSGASVDSLQDSLLYDGWNRVIAMVSYRNMGHTGLLVRDTFAFDRSGNLKTTAGAESYDATTDRLLSRSGGACGTWSYSFDRAGNLTQAVCGATTWTYGYSALNQLRTVKQNGTLIARYGYDVMGRRIAKRVYSSGTGGTIAYTRFVYHGGQVTFEADSAGTIGLRYTWGIGADNLLAIRDAAGNHYYTVQDLLSSVRGLVKRDGTWVRSLQYGAYGAVLRDTASASAPSWELRYRWTGREYDAETGWYFFRARYYDAGARRFVQEDPAGYAGSANVYAYGDGNPIEGRDPSGLRMDGSVYYNPKWETLFNSLNCWSHDCMNNYDPGNGSGVLNDWDGNGIDDFEDFRQHHSDDDVKSDVKNAADEAKQQSTFQGFGGGGGFSGGGAGTDNNGRTVILTYDPSAPSNQRTDDFHAWGGPSRIYDFDVVNGGRLTIQHMPSGDYYMFTRTGDLTTRNGTVYSGTFQVYGFGLNTGGFVVVSVDHHFFKPGR